MLTKSNIFECRGEIVNVYRPDGSGTIIVTVKCLDKTGFYNYPKIVFKNKPEFVYKEKDKVYIVGKWENAKNNPGFILGEEIKEAKTVLENGYRYDCKNRFFIAGKVIKMDKISERVLVLNVLTDDERIVPVTLYENKAAMVIRDFPDFVECFGEVVTKTKYKNNGSKRHFQNIVAEDILY